MRPPRWKALVEKSVAACCGAIEIYNKPLTLHREETFAMLVVAGWELLLKARLLKEGNNVVKCICETGPATRRDGTPGKRTVVIKNRAGNPKTITLGAALQRTIELPIQPLELACKMNLLLLTEIRDNAVHFMNEDRELAVKVHEIGAASLVNYVRIVHDWFDHSLQTYRFAILPLSFDGVSTALALPAKRSAQAANLLAHMKEACANVLPSSDGRFTVSLQVATKIVGSRSTDAVPVKMGKGPDAVKVEMTEEQFRERWPHDYARLLALLKSRLPEMKQNNAFHALKRSLETDENFARVRLLDFNNPKSSKKTYYGVAMVDAMAARLKQAQAGPVEATS